MADGDSTSPTVLDIILLVLIAMAGVVCCYDRIIKPRRQDREAETDARVSLEASHLCLNDFSLVS